MPDDDVERIPVRRLDDDGGAVELVDRGDPDDPVEDVLARLGAPLDEVMLTQRAVRKVRFDPVDDRIVAPRHRARPEGAHRQQRPELGVRRRQGPGHEGGVRPRLPAGVVGLRRARAPDDPGRRVDGQGPRRRRVAGRALRGHPGARRRLPAGRTGAADPHAADRQHELLRVDLSERAEPPPGGTGDGSGRVADHAAAAVGRPHPAHPRAAAVGHAGVHRPARLAAWPLRAHHPPAGGRRRPPRPLRPASRGRDSLAPDIG